MPNESARKSLDLILRDSLQALQQLTGAENWQCLLVGTSQAPAAGPTTRRSTPARNDTTWRSSRSRTAWWCSPTCTTPPGCCGSSPDTG